MEGLFTEQTFLNAIFWIVLLLMMILFLVVGFFMIWYITYRIKVRYYEVIGKDKNENEILRYVKNDRAKLIKIADGLYNLRFFWKRRKIEPPPSEAYLSTKKGYEIHVKTNWIDYDPMILRANPGFETVPMHKRLWLMQTAKQAREQFSKPKFWEKYGTLVLMFGTVILIIGLVAFFIWYEGKLQVYIIDKAAQTAAEIAKMKPIAPGA